MRYCPDVEKIKDYFMIKNGYSNDEDRVSFSVEIVKCNEEEGETCKNKELVSKLLNSMYFTMYNIEETIDFKDPDKMMERPVRTLNKFH